jgi:predicted nucleotidyltransferase
VNPTSEVAAPTDHYPDGDLPSEDVLLRTLEETVAALDSGSVEYLLIGGIGSFALARPRITHDIDVFVRPDGVERSLELLAGSGFEVELHDPSWLAKAHKRGVLVDIVFRSSGDIYLDDEMLLRSETREYKGVLARVIAPEDLLVIKALATSEATFHHWYDALAIISRCEIDWDYVLRRASEAGPRRVLSLLLYAESSDLAVPTAVIAELHDVLHGGHDA